MISPLHPGRNYRLPGCISLLNYCSPPCSYPLGQWEVKGSHSSTALRSPRNPQPEPHDKNRSRVLTGHSPSALQSSVFSSPSSAFLTSRGFLRFGRGIGLFSRTVFSFSSSPTASPFLPRPLDHPLSHRCIATECSRTSERSSRPVFLLLVDADLARPSC